MDTLYIAYRYGDTRLFARLVCMLRGGDSAHVELVWQAEADGMWHCVSSSWMDGGPRLKTMPLPAGKWRIYRAELRSGLARAWLRANEGRGYGWTKLLRFVFPWFRPSVGGPICTQAWAQVTGLGHADSWDLRTAEAVDVMRYERVQ